MPPLKITNVHASLSTGKISDILRISKLGYWEYDLVAHGLFLAREVYQMFNIDTQPGGLGVNELASLAQPEDLALLEKKVQAALAGQNVLETDLWIRSGDQPGRAIHIDGEVVRDPDHKPLRIIGTITDITGKRAIEDRLRHVEEMVNANTNTMAFIDANYNYLAVNKAFLDTFKVTLDQTIGQSALKLMGEKHFYNIAKPLFDRCLAGESISVQRTHVHFTGDVHVIDLNYLPYRGDDGKVTGIVLCAHNITNLKQAQRSLEESERALRKAQRIAKMGHWKRNLKNDTVILSEELYHITGLPPHAYDGSRKTLYGLIHPDDRDYVLQFTSAAVDNGSDYKLEYRIVRPDGELRYVHVQAEVECDGQGQPVNIFGVLMDITEMKQAENNLLRYEHIINTTTDFMAFVDSSYVYRAVNQGYLNTFVKTWDEVVGHSMAEILGDEYFETWVKQDVNQCLAGESVSCERWVQNPALGESCMDIRYRPYHEKNGRITGVVISIRNITEKKRAEEMLLRYEQIVNSSSDLMAIVDADRTYLAVNRRFLELRGQSREEVIGRKMEEVLGQQYYQTQIKANLARCLQGENTSFQCWHEYPIGAKRYTDVNYIPYRQADGTVIGAVINVHDITGLKMAQESLEKSEQQLQEAQRIAQLGFWEWDMVNDTIYRSEVADQILGIQHDTESDHRELRQRDDSRFHPDDRERVQQAIQDALAGIRPYNLEHRYLRWPDNDIGHVHVQAEISRDATGKPVKMFGTILDITHLKRVEEELAKHRDHLEVLVAQRTQELEAAQQELIRKERLATLGQLTATVSHELRNPLGASVLSLHTLKRLIKGDNRLVKEMFERLERNILRCDHIIDELLDFTRVSNFSLTHKCMDAWLLELLEEQHAPEGLSVKLNLCLNDLVLRIDPDHLRRAVINVFENARHSMLKAEDPGELRPGATITVSSRQFKDRIEVSIQDQGHGIPADVLPNIFEPLFSTKSFGVGLGLPTVKRIMEQHGGGIDIETEAGKGTSVILWLPGYLVIKKVAS